MKDPVFSGRDVAEAVRTASRTLAVPEGKLRYVVLDAGQAGGRGLSPTEARIAVLMERPGQPPHPGSSTAAETRAREVEAERRPRREERSDAEGGVATIEPAEAIRALVLHWARAADSELQVDVVEGRDAVDVEIEGSGTTALFDPQGETLAALEHVIERVYGRSFAPRRIRVRCAGYREYRDAALRERALELAREVLESGEARTTEPLNSYERRVIHVAVEALDGVETYSVGEGSGRRVTIAPQGVGTRAVAGAAGEDPTAERAAGDDRNAGPEPEAEGVPAVEPAAVRAEPPAPETPPASAPALEWRRFDRPPHGGGGTGLM